MAVPWIQVYSDLDRHPKIGRLAYELGLKSSAVDAEASAVGIVICLWSWVAQSVSDGDLSKCMSRTIANACRWRGDADKLVNALKQAGFLDEDMRVHDWEEYAELFINREEYRKEQTRKRVQGYRDRKRAEAEA